MKNHTIHKIGAMIAKYRKAAGITQAELAEKLELSNDAISRLERGHISLTVSRLFELAEIFECDAADLLNASSHRIQDHERRLMAMLNKLEARERVMLLGLIEQLIHWKLNAMEEELE
ncbi:helix-turn-helix domain-containing protein [Uruburuella testudinis]|uniref:Helix-turn-helix domain-containing protein n=1 Tax=Uruburuella testudinis TaxID=1282863 RepID=A0ABY4DVA3_9NEIS|nr:helix-turn-helix transcriptional regulator [Uruburuella testudinis]UOO82970.1 helix-turn-helix domain-containing protein [Uruburuella testudinis]